jgi:hypothetical protein
MTQEAQNGGRPLLISDCDEVILHFVTHFADWVDEAADLTFAIDAPGFAGALRSRDGRVVPEERVWPLLDMFFEREMYRQNVVPGATEALLEIGRHADMYPHQYRRRLSGQPARPARGVRHPPPRLVQPRRQGPAGAGADRGDEAERDRFRRRPGGSP